MKIVLNKKEGDTKSINFIDENDVYLGYDLSEHCCETTGYYFDTDKGHKYDLTEKELEGYTFDVTSVKTVSTPESPDNCECKTDRDINALRIQLAHPNKPSMLLVLFNIHNGFYAHPYVLSELREDNIIKGSI